MNGKYYKVTEGGYELVGSYDDTSKGNTVINNINYINVTEKAPWKHTALAEGMKRRKIILEIRK